MTERDSLLAVLEEFGDWPECQRLGEQLFAGEITLHEEIERQFATVTTPLEDVVDWVVENVVVRPGLPELVERFHPLVVSSGFHELIEPVLDREGVRLRLLANHVEVRPDGWRVTWQDESICQVCGQSCKRALVPMNGSLVYAGDGYSDRCVAQLADRIFARRGLAAYLDEQGVGYEWFDDLHDITKAIS